MLVLNGEEVEALLDVRRLIDALAPAMAALSVGAVSLPQRVMARVPERDAMLGVMPVYLNAAHMLSTKLVSVFPRNSDAGRPSHQAVVLVFDAADGTPLALMEGAYLTAVRTAAGSALATRLLARPERPGGDVLAIVGTGVQAASHARILAGERHLREIRILGRTARKAADLAETLAGATGCPCTCVASFQEAAAGADLICATTHSAEPVVFGRDLAPGVHVNSVGLNTAGRELDTEAVVRSRVVVEARSAALNPMPGGANDLVWPIRDGFIDAYHIHAEVGELVTGTRPGRTDPDQITLYKSVGVAVQDAVAAQLVLEAARERQAGIEVPI